MLLWKWKHLIPHDEVRAEIDKLKTSVKKDIFAEWSCIKATSQRNDSGLYMGKNDWEIKLAKKFPMNPAALTNYIMTKILDFNGTRADLKDMYLCPYACHEHRIHNTPWERRNTGLWFSSISGEVSVRGPTNNGQHQVLNFEHLESGDYVLQVVKNEHNNYELPTSIMVGLVDELGRVIDLVTDRHVYSVGMQVIRLSQHKANDIADRIRDRLERNRRVIDLNQRAVAPVALPSIGGDRIIDLGGL